MRAIGRTAAGVLLGLVGFAWVTSLLGRRSTARMVEATLGASGAALREVIAAGAGQLAAEDEGERQLREFLRAHVRFCGLSTVAHAGHRYDDDDAAPGAWWCPGTLPAGDRDSVWCGSTVEHPPHGMCDGWHRYSESAAN